MFNTWKDNRTMRVTIEKKVLVFSPPVNENSRKWGVYAIPRLWRRLDGKLSVRFNGMEDSAYSSSRQLLPDLYFVSEDRGQTWQADPMGEAQYDPTIFTGLDAPYIRCRDGRILAMRCICTKKPIAHAAHQKEFPMPYNQIKLRTYLQKDIPEECLRHELLCFEPGRAEPVVTPVDFDFPEREVMVEAEKNEDGKRVPMEPPVIFMLSHIGSLTELPDGTLAGVCFGQHPQIRDRYCGEGYLVCSVDGGKTWKKRSLITNHADRYRFGLVGDGAEMSLTVASNGDLLCVTRMEMCLDHTKCGSTAGTMLFISKDNGYTWSPAREIADSSVTPHILTLKNGVILLIYGRPGVHFRYSLDNGETFSAPVSIIGKTLEQELADGAGYLECKYRNSSSYSNTFAEVLEDDTVLVLYNDLRYREPGDTECHKAAFVAHLKCVDEK